MFDVIVIGGGPAGLSAAITLRQRGKDVAVISNDYKDSGLYKAREVGNYPGLPEISGPDLLDKLAGHAYGSGAISIAGKVSNILPGGEVFYVGHEAEIESSKCIIIATGVVQSSLFPGEEELLGNGVSYCATCDGMLFRGKRVCVVTASKEAGEEAEYLASIGCEVIRLNTKNITVNGEKHVSSVTADGKEIECDGVFILRHAIAPHMLLKGLKLEDGHILTGRSGKTNIPGVFAAGDCTGTPYQVAKAVGEGLSAALTAVEHIDSSNKQYQK